MTSLTSNNNNRKQTFAYVFFLLAISLASTFITLRNGPKAGQRELLHASGSWPATQSAYAAQDRTSGTLANCRYGATAAESHVGLISKLGTGAFYKFDYPVWSGPLPQNQAEQIHMIRVKQKKNGADYLPGYTTSIPLDHDLQEFIRSNPGKLWLIGNEIERGPNPGRTVTSQGDIFPEEYAVAYHELYSFIKASDPTARVAIGGMIQPTPMRLQYLDIVWQTYLAKYGKPMPVDVWNVHLYPLSEVKSDGTANNIASVALGTNPALGKRMPDSAADCQDPEVYCVAEHDDVRLIAEHLLTFREWMKDHGQQQKPLIISEHGIVFPVWQSDEYGNPWSRERAQELLESSLRYFDEARDPALGYELDDHRLVQQVIWFNAYTNAGFHSNLAAEKAGDKLSETGEAYQAYIAAETPSVNLIAERVFPTKIRKNSLGLYDVSLSMTFRNNGNTAVPKSFQVTFYKDAGLTQPLGSIAVNPLVRGCAMQSYTATYLWQNVAEGRQQVWARVDAQDVIAESLETDNVAAVQFSADDSSLYYDLDIQVISEAPEVAGTVSVSPSLEAYPAGTIVEVKATSYPGWSFERWSGDLAGTNPEATLTMSSDKRVQAHFTEDVYSVERQIIGEGQIDLKPAKETYAYGEWVTVQAIPAAGWRFVTWRGALLGGKPLEYLRLEQDVSVTAVFEQVLENVVDIVYAPITANAP